ncbi:MAG: hypothetical protein KKA70_12745 [Proteobacteria bacterium]|nr:hypothetical protein [Pseudomonadota bacterium]MBU1715457.1 hypothetical protein [Pseudomonadota bacterium]
MIRPALHLVLHFLVPGVVAGAFYSKRWVRAWLIMISTMVVDLDHLLASPVYDPDRCGIGFHPLHSFIAITLYSILLFFPKARIVAIGLLIHMALDGIDCLMIG